MRRKPKTQHEDILQRQKMLEENVAKLLQEHHQSSDVKVDLLLLTLARTQEEIRVLKEQLHKISKVLLRAILDKDEQSESERKQVEEDTKDETRSPYIIHHPHIEHND